MTPARLEKLRLTFEKKKNLVLPDYDSTGHWYRDTSNPNLRLNSVTQSLQFVKDPSIANWKMNRALEFVEQTLMREETLEHLSDIVKQAKNVPQEQFQEAGDVGTAIHKVREVFINDWLKERIKPASVREYYQGNDPRIISGLLALDNFYNYENYQPIVCEFNAADWKIGVGGCIDDIGTVKDYEGISLIDLKTSNQQEKLSYWLQVLSYVYLLRKTTGFQVRNVFILHVSKDKPVYSLIPITCNPTTIKSAVAMIRAGQALKRIEMAMEEKHYIPKI